MEWLKFKNSFVRLFTISFNRNERKENTQRAQMTGFENRALSVLAVKNEDLDGKPN